MSARLLAAVTALLVFASVFFGGGSDDSRLTWIGAGALLAAGAALTAMLLGLSPGPSLGRTGALAVGLLAAFVVWTGVSIEWSILPDRSWSYFNRGLVYLALLVLGLFVGALVPRAPRLVAGALAALLGLALLWALAGKVAPALGPDEARIARLRSPVGYWNALGLLADFALALALWLAARRVHARSVRAVGAALAYLSLVALALTSSRGAILTAAVVVLVTVALARERTDAAVAFAVAALPAAALSWWALGRPGLVEAGVEREDGLAFGLLFLAGGAIAFAVARALAARPPNEREERLLGRALVVVSALAAVAVVGAVAVRGSEWVDAFANPPDVQLPSDPTRIAEVSSNNRWNWWQEAWQGFEERPVAGSGAASFALTHLRLRESDQVVTEPHNVLLQFLTELGLVGFLLFAGALACGAIAIRATLRRLDADDRAAGLALSIVALAFVVHALVDYDWDFVAVCAPFFVVAGVLLAAGRAPVRASRRPLWAAGAAALVLTGVSSLAVPWLAERRAAEAYDLALQSPGHAVAAAEAANSLNPLSIDPLIAWAAAEEGRGNLRGAYARYVEATERQPDNPDTWRALGTFELQVGNAPDRALAHLDCMYALDPFGPGGELLDEAREASPKPASCPRRGLGARP